MKHIKKAVSMILCLLLLISPTAVSAEEIQSSVSKDESVYVFLNPDGTVRKQTVSCWLHSDSGLSSVSDVSKLTDIQNIKGELAPEQSGDTLKWATDDNDVYYQGEYDGQLPFSVDVTYTLDGNQISAEELDGKSGELEITVKVKNERSEGAEVNGLTRIVYAPLAVAAVVDLPAGNFKNIDVGGGQLLTDSQNQIAFFVLLPGLRENYLGISTFDSLLSELDGVLTDTFTIKADVTDFTMPVMDLAASSSVDGLKEININDKVTELRDGMESLYEASGQLQEGTELLNSALSQFDSKMGEFKDGLSQFDSGLADAAAGAKQVNDGTKQLQSAIEKLNTQMSEQLIPGIKNSSSKQKELTDKMNELKKQLEGLKLPDTDEISKQLSSALNQVCSSSSDATIQILTGGKTIDDLPEQQKQMILQARQQILEQANEQLSQMMSQLDMSSIAQIQGLLSEIETLSGDLMGSMNQLIQALYSENDDPSNPKTLCGAIAALSVGADSLVKGTSGLTDGMSDLSTASKTLDSAVSSFKQATGELSSKSGELSDGVKELKRAGIDPICGENVTRDIDTAMAIKDKMENMSEQFESYTGAPEGADVSTRFIVKVESPEKGAEDSSDTSVQEETGTSFWQRIVDLFKNLFS